MEITKYRFVHLSDIHFGQEQGGELVIQNDVREQLLRDCISQVDNSGPASGVLVTGDIAFSGERTEYEKSGEWLDRLADAAGCDRNAVRVVPGNHDVDLDRIGRAGQIVHEKLRTVQLSTLDNDLTAIAKDPEESNLLVSKLAAYREFAARYGCDFQSVEKPLWEKNYPLGMTYILRFVGLNSVQVSDKEDAPLRLVLGANQYVIGEEDNVEYIVMVHHPIHWFRDNDKAAAYLKRARVMIVGHKHQLDIHKMTDPQGLEQLVIYAGATNPPQGSDHYQYRYNWLDFALDSESDKRSLVVTVHPRVWDHDPPRFVPDQARLGGKVSADISLVCPNYKPVSEDQPTEALDATPVEGQTSLAQGDSQMTDNESLEFDRLRYFFWHYLDWRKRIRVLVDLDILPELIDKPIPQTMERLALDQAKRQGMLHELWEAVMKMVPEHERATNPFTPSRK